VTAPDPRLNEIQASAEKYVAAHARMIELDGGIGLLHMEAPEMYADWEAWDDASRVQHADTALYLLAELRKAHEALERVESVADDLSTRGESLEAKGYNGSIYSNRAEGRATGYLEGARLIRAAVDAAKGDEQ
jgi:hypothetical protein